MTKKFNFSPDHIISYKRCSNDTGYRLVKKTGNSDKA